MSILYKMGTLPPRSGENLKYLYPVPVIRGTKTLDDWAQEATMSGTLSPADVAAAMKSLESFVIKSLRGGYQVTLDGLGTLSVTLASRKVTDEKEIRSHSIDVKTVNFRCSKTLVTNLKGATIERASLPKQNDDPFELRKQRMLRFMATNPVINRNTYRSINGCSDHTWREDRRIYLLENLLLRQGKSPLNYYVLAPDYKASQIKDKGKD